jgi:hypothetical protein
VVLECGTRGRGGVGYCVARDTPSNGKSEALPLKDTAVPVMHPLQRYVKEVCVELTKVPFSMGDSVRLA